MTVIPSEPVEVSRWLDALIRDDAADPATLMAAAAIDPATLMTPLDQVLLVQAADRVAAWAASRVYAAVGAMSTRDDARLWSVGRSHVVEEVRLARREGETTTRTAVEVAEALQDAPVLAAALAAGRISDGHVREFTAVTATITGARRQAILVAVADRVLPRAVRESARQFRATVTAAVLHLDPQGQADRHGEARTHRYVTARRGRDGMGHLHAMHEWPIVNAIMRDLDSAARAVQAGRGGASAVITCPDAARGACRADALAAAVLGSAMTVTGTPVPARAERPGVTVPVVPPRVILTADLVIDLATLRREADHPCLLDGQLIPAQVGRDLARDVAAWRRVVTDPVTGHLLDYGTATYLPGSLRRFIRARDGSCTVPYCERPARDCQMDHRTPFPDGPSDTANTGLYCGVHHRLKTAGRTWVTDGRSSGSMMYQTHWGQQVPHPPRPYLDTGGVSPPARTTADPDPPCPF